MQRIYAKICGLSTPETVDAAVRHGASHVGFVFFAKSPRNVDAAKAGSLGRPVPPRVKKVGVFVDPDDALLADAIERAGLDAIQLHGDEPPARLAAIRARHKVEIWKAIPVRNARRSGRRARLSRGCRPGAVRRQNPEGSGAARGHGAAVRLGAARRLRACRAVGAVGRDRPGQCRACGRDHRGEAGRCLVGVESAPGVKDVDKIAAFLQRVAQL
jgi:phosphoribosylanthranilate isomerase